MPQRMLAGDIWPVDPETPMRGPMGDIMPARFWAMLLDASETMRRLIQEDDRSGRDAAWQRTLARNTARAGGTAA